MLHYFKLYIISLPSDMLSRYTLCQNLKSTFLICVMTDRIYAWIGHIPRFCLQGPLPTSFQELRRVQLWHEKDFLPHD